MTKTGVSIQLPMHTLCQHKLSANQWLTLWLLHSEDWDTLLKYHAAHGGVCGEDEMELLIDRGFILHFNINPEEPMSSENMAVTEKFTDLLYGYENGHITDTASPLVDDDVAFNEFFAAYPAYIMVQGQRVSGRSADIDELCAFYAKLTKGKRDTHEEIMENLKWGLEQGLITMGIAKFLKSRQWLGLRALRESGEAGGHFTKDI